MKGMKMKFKNIKSMDVYRKCSTLCFESESGNPLSDNRLIDKLEITAFEYDPDIGELKIYYKENV